MTSLAGIVILVPGNKIIQYGTMEVNWYLFIGSMKQENLHMSEILATPIELWSHPTHTVKVQSSMNSKLDRFLLIVTSDVTFA